jgi:hypothetical protein
MKLSRYLHVGMHADTTSSRYPPNLQALIIHHTRKQTRLHTSILPFLEFPYPHVDLRAYTLVHLNTKRVAISVCTSAYFIPRYLHVGIQSLSANMYTRPHAYTSTNFHASMASSAYVGVRAHRATYFHDVTYMPAHSCTSTSLHNSTPRCLHEHIGIYGNMPTSLHTFIAFLPRCARVG